MAIMIGGTLRPKLDPFNKLDDNKEMRFGNGAQVLAVGNGQLSRQCRIAR